MYIILLLIIIALLTGILFFLSHKIHSDSLEVTNDEPSNLDISMIPKKVSLDNDMLPYIKNKKYAWGKRFNAFITSDDIYYHKSTCTNLSGKKKEVIHRYLAIQKYTPCPMCNPNNTIDSWYIEFLKKNYGVDMSDTYTTDNPVNQLPVIALDSVNSKHKQFKSHQ